MDLSLILFVVWLLAALLGKIVKAEKRGIEIYPFIAIIYVRSPERFFKRLTKRLTALNKLLGAGSALMLPTVIGTYFIMAATIWTSLNKLLKKVLFIDISLFSDTVPILVAVLGITILLHEIFHALACVSRNVKIKKFGTFVIFPALIGGFVEVGEPRSVAFFRRERKRFIASLGRMRRRTGIIRRRKRLTASKMGLKRVTSAHIQKLIYKSFKQIAAAGILANYLLASLGLLAMLGAPVLQGLYVPQGVRTLEPLRTLDGVTIPAGTIIYNVNGTPISAPDELVTILQNASSNSTFIIYTDRGTYYVNSSSLRKSMVTHFRPKVPFMLPLEYLMMGLRMLVVLNVLSVLLNAIPAFLTDGARYISFLLYEKVKSYEKAERIYYVLNTLGITILILAFVALIK